MVQVQGYLYIPQNGLMLHDTWIWSHWWRSLLHQVPGCKLCPQNNQSLVGNIKVIVVSSYHPADECDTVVALDAISLEWSHVRLVSNGEEDQCVGAGLCNCQQVWLTLAPWLFMVIARLLRSWVRCVVAMVRKYLLVVFNARHFWPVKGSKQVISR